MTNSAKAFMAGYNHGHISGQYCSRREAETRFPAWSREQIKSYLNGRDDGVNGDSTRYSLIHATT